MLKGSFPACLYEFVCNLGAAAGKHVNGNRVVILEIKRQRYSKLTARHLGLGENHRPELN